MKDAINLNSTYNYYGDYFNVKLEKVVKYNYRENDVYVYSLVIIPVYNEKISISGIKLEPNINNKKIEKLFYDINFTFEKLDKKKYTYEKLDEFIGIHFKFEIVDNSIDYGYELKKDDFLETLTNFNIIIKVNGKKDIINISNFEIEEYDKNDTIDLIEFLENTGKLQAILTAYLRD